ARELRAAGFDSGLAPVLDCLLNPANTVIDDRAFGTAPDIIAACGVAFVEALLSEGLVPVAKHFPGHGRTSVDSHLALPDVDATIDELERWDLVPFRAALGAGCPAVMVAHVRYRVLDPALPASLSAEVIGGLLRRRLGFSGLVLSDDLEMAAVASTWGVAGAARRFLAAGGDLALVCRRAGARPRSERLRRTGDVRAVVDAGARARLARAADRRTHRRHRHGPPADAVRRRDARALRGSRGLLGQPPRPGLRHVPGKLARLRANAEARWAHIRGAAGGGHLHPVPGRPAHRLCVAAALPQRLVLRQRAQGSRPSDHARASGSHALHQAGQLH